MAYFDFCPFNNFFLSYASRSRPHASISINPHHVTVLLLSRSKLRSLPCSSPLPSSGFVHLVIFIFVTFAIALLPSLLLAISRAASDAEGEAGEVRAELTPVRHSAILPLSIVFGRKAIRFGCRWPPKAPPLSWPARKPQAGSVSGRRKRRFFWFMLGK